MRNVRTGSAPWLKVHMAALFGFLYLPLVVLVVWVVLRGRKKPE